MENITAAIAAITTTTETTTAVITTSFMEEDEDVESTIFTTDEIIVQGLWVPPSPHSTPTEHLQLNKILETIFAVAIYSVPFEHFEKVFREDEQSQNPEWFPLQ